MDTSLFLFIISKLNVHAAIIWVSAEYTLVLSKLIYFVIIVLGWGTYGRLTLFC